MQGLQDKHFIQTTASFYAKNQPAIEILGYAVPNGVRLKVNANKLNIRKLHTVTLARDAEIIADHSNVPAGERDMIHSQFYMLTDCQFHGGFHTDWEAHTDIENVDGNDIFETE